MTNQVPIHTLKCGQKFRIPKYSQRTFTFQSMDGMYCIAYCVETLERLNWSGPVEVVE